MAKATPLNDTMILGNIARVFFNEGIPLEDGVVVVNPTTNPYQWRFVEVPARESVMVRHGEIFHWVQPMINEAKVEVPGTLQDNILVVVSPVGGFSYQQRVFWTRGRVIVGALVAAPCAFLGLWVVGPYFFR